MRMAARSHAKRVAVGVIPKTSLSPECHAHPASITAQSAIQTQNPPLRGKVGADPMSAALSFAHPDGPSARRRNCRRRSPTPPATR